jgi:hypothetical protein
MTAYSLPSSPKIMGQSFKLNPLQAANPTRGGNYMSVDLGEALWSAEVSTTPLSAAQAGQYDALRAKLRGVARTVYVYDVKRQRPIAYLGVADSTGARMGLTTRKIGLLTRTIGAGEKPWGYPRIASVSRSASTLSLVDCRAGTTWKAGDYLAWDDGPARRLHIIVEDATADASGDVTVTVEPPPPTTATASLPVDVSAEKASAEMILVSYEQPWRVGQSSAATFSAVQVLRRY